MKNSSERGRGLKIRTLLFAANALIVVVGFGLMVRWIVEGLRPRYLEAVEEVMVDASVVLAKAIEVDLERGPLDTERLREVWARVERERFQAAIYGLLKTGVDLQVYVTDGQGVVVFDSGHPENEGRNFHNLWRDVRLTFQGKYGARTTWTREGDPRSSVMHVAAPVWRDGAVAGSVTVYKPTTNANEFIAAAGEKVVVAGVGFGAAALLCSLLASYGITRPLERLTSYARAVADGAKQPLPQARIREVKVLGRAIEDMRDALEGKQYVERYVQTLTHEVKSPLASIRGAAELLREAGMPEERRERFLANIIAEAGRIDRVVENLLQLSAIEARKTLGPVSTFDLAPVVREVLESAGPVLEQRRVALREEVGGELRIKGDAYLVRQALENLLRNAMEFSPENGVIRVEAVRDGERVRCAVEDEGPGVPEYALARVFERFFSLPRPGTDRKSSGLGLTFVREVAELHGGKVWLENRLPKGARAVLELPAV